MGLVSRIVPPEALMETVMGLAHEIAENTSTISSALSRQMLWKGLGDDHPMASHIRESSTDMPDDYPWWEKRRFEVS
jgi:enoyl-CoA hydratase/carnithine racemase